MKLLLLPTLYHTTHAHTHTHTHTHTHKIKQNKIHGLVLLGDIQFLDETVKDSVISDEIKWVKRGKFPLKFVDWKKRNNSKRRCDESKRCFLMPLHPLIKNEKRFHGDFSKNI